MGASFQTMIVPAETSVADLHKRFEQVQADDQYENGHSYSGGFGMARGLAVDEAKTFETYQGAYDHLCENAQKWEEAIAVCFIDEREGLHGSPNPNKGKKFWMIGAWCAS